MNLIDAVNIRKQYQNHLALDDVSFSVEKGSIFGLLGPNGAGKTTFIRILNQITAPDSGNIFFDGERLNKTHIETIGYLPEERGLYKKMKVGEQAIYLARLKGLEKSVALAELKIWFEKFDIINWWNKKVEELSKGMAQKIQFITTIIHKPTLLIFDEPFSGFDPVNVNLLKEEILQLKNQGATIVFSTHNMASVEELCDDIVLIDKSRIVLDGNVKEIKKQFSTNKFSFEIELNQNVSEELLLENLKLDEYSLKGKALNAIISINNSFDNANELLYKLLNYGSLKHFSEILPSMNDIFIKTVTQ